MTSTAPSTRSTQAHSDDGSAAILCLAVIPRSQYNSFPLYWLLLPGKEQFDDETLNQALCEILIDPLQEDLWCCPPPGREPWVEKWNARGFRWWAERQFLPGVTDNLAHTVEEALVLKGFDGIKVSSGRGYLFEHKSIEQAMSQAQSTLGVLKAEDAPKFVTLVNTYKLHHPLTDRFTVHDLERKDILEQLLQFPVIRLPSPPPTAPVNLDLADNELEQLSKDRLLALTLAEMKAIRSQFHQPSVRQARAEQGLPEWPTDVELEILAQTWSEHCKHKIFNATISHSYIGFTGNKKSETVRSLYKTYIQAPTKRLMHSRPDLLSVFEDNSGVIRWNDKWAVCFKVETHNSPSALEPYGGALTGILGVNRDILGTGLGAKPIFNTDVFCFALPSADLPVRPKLLPAETIINGVRKGVEDGGNKSGIPTVNGALYFDRRYRAKPLVFCGTGGILPLEVRGKTGFGKHTACGDTIVVAGGRVGKDGIHGATFSSESLHEGSPVSAVQIGDPFTQKRLLDFVIEARDAGLITGITDNGAGGLSSSVGEMARITGGASMEIANIPSKYPGLADWEIVVSESQERMTISTRSFASLKQLADKHHVEVTDIGVFHDKGYFEVTKDGRPVAILDLGFLHDGLPPMELEAEGRQAQITMTTGPMPGDLQKVLLSLLSHPNICSREQVIRQYDHEVQGMSVIKPLMGLRQLAPCDAAVICPIYGEKEGLVISNGLCPNLSAHDAHIMAVCAVDEAVRNAVCVGADPDTIVLLDNFCWPDPVETQKNVHGKAYLSQLVRACQGLHDAVMAFNAPLISGKDSMKNDFDDGVVRLSIPPTLLVSALGRIEDIDRCISMEFKRPGDVIYLLSAGRPGLAGSHYEELTGWQSAVMPALDLNKAAQMYQQLHFAIESSLVASAHDLSEGGLAVSLAESTIGGGLGCEIDADQLTRHDIASDLLITKMDKLLSRTDIVLFAEGPGRIAVSIPPEHLRQWEELWKGFDVKRIGVVTESRRLTIKTKTADHEQGRAVIDLPIAELEKAWRTPLPFDETGA